MKVRIVLVEPHEAGNVGAAARAMKNFGVGELAIVGARPRVTRDAAEWWAKGGLDVVQSARRFATLQEALADVHLSVAATAMRARHVYEQLTPSDVARLAEETLGDDHTLAIVFGREESGLSGASVPVVLKKLGADPAVASSIILSTITDIVSMGSMLALATLLIAQMT